jgi:peroxiredoxin (alkyl hydroperoxide reductase subunit C)
MSLVGKKAPQFIAQAAINGEVKSISLDDYNDSYKIVFFYPLDFTFVCPTELHAFQEKITEFKQRNTEIIGISIDSVHSHLAWWRTPKNNGGIEGITYPLVSDLHKTISRAWLVLDEDTGVALRGQFILDKNNIIQSMLVNNDGIGRNIDEALRLVDALQHVEKYGHVCPANWTIGEQDLVPTIEGVQKYFE